jgi:hypothetical protein
MVDLQIIQNDKDYFLGNLISKPIKTENFSIEKNHRGNWRLIDIKRTYDNIHNEDEKEFITHYARRLLNVEFESILISGLGLGVIPFVCQNKTKIVDVIEISVEIIELVRNFGYLNQNVNVIQSDVNLYHPKKKYDIILFDHWLTFAEKKEVDLLKSKYSTFLNENGFFYIPIQEQFTNYENWV